MKINKFTKVGLPTACLNGTITPILLSDAEYNISLSQMATDIKSKTNKDIDTTKIFSFIYEPNDHNEKKMYVKKLITLLQLYDLEDDFDNVFETIKDTNYGMLIFDKEQTNDPNVDSDPSMTDIFFVMVSNDITRSNIVQAGYAELSNILIECCKAYNKKYYDVLPTKIANMIKSTSFFAGDRSLVYPSFNTVEKIFDKVKDELIVKPL